MSVRQKTEIIHEGKYLAEVAVSLTDNEEGWSPSMSLDDAYMLDDVRAALKAGDLEAAAKYGRVYELRPINTAP
jgi:hypothetical protein